MQKPITFIAILMQLICANDLSDHLEGYGNFGVDYIFSKWKLGNQEEFKVDIIESGDDKALQIEKVKGELQFKEGITIEFEEAQPGHIRFYFASSNKDIEDTNLRLKNEKLDKTAVSFRCGYAGFVRVNDNQMVAVYNSTVSTPQKQIWTKADIILDWENRVVDIYINETFKGSANFYHEEVTTVDTVLIYNLNPETTSWWKNIEVCNKKCPNFVFSRLLQVSLAILVVLNGF